MTYDHFHRLSAHFLRRSQGHHSDRERYLWTDSKPHVVRRKTRCGIDGRRLAKPDKDFSASNRQKFAGTDVKGNSLPSPGIDLQTQSRKRFHFRVRRYARFFAVTTELAAHNLLWIQRLDGFQYLDLFIADGFAVCSNRRLHGEVRHNLEQMVLHHITNGARLIVEGASALNAKLLRHRDLDTFDVVAIPERLEKRVCESEIQHILNGPLPEVMIDTEYRFLRKSADQDLIQVLCRYEVGSKRLFDDDA